MLKPSDYIENLPTQAFSYKAARFQAYQATQIDGELCIIGSGKPSDDEDILYIDKIDRTNLLVSLLRLYEYLDPTLYGHFDEYIQDADITRIINWCYTNGMPMEASTTKENSLWRKHGKVGFIVRDFYNQLHDLYICYLLWRRIDYCDTDKSNFYAKTSIEKCKFFLQSHMLTLEIRLLPNFDQYPPTLYLDCENIMTVAKAQMLLLCINQGVPYIGICEVCAKPFSKYRKNNTLCEQCQRTRYQRSRNKARAEARRHHESNDKTNE